MGGFQDVVSVTKRNDFRIPLDSRIGESDVDSMGLHEVSPENHVVRPQTRSHTYGMSIQ